MPPPDPRRIVVLGPFPPLRGGIAQFDARTVRALRLRGHDVTPVSYRRLYPGILFPGRSQWEPGGRDGGEAAPVVDTLSPASWRKTATMIREVGADFLIVAYWSPVVAPAMGRIARTSGAPVIGLVHNARPHERLPLGDRFTRYFLRACSGVLTLSEGVAADVRALGYDGRLAVTAHPAYETPAVRPSRDRARSELGLPRDGALLLFFGLVRPYKGLDVLIEALPRVLARRPDTRLLVAGEWYGDAGPIRSRITELGLGERVHIDDRYVPEDEIVTVFAAADLVVQPYRSATQSGVLQLAASHGVPCVATDVGDLARPIRTHGAGLVVPPADPAALAAAVVEALEAGRRSRMADGARAMAAARGWDGFAETLEQLATVVAP